ncbi:MAG TPA: cyanophycin synthetase, partial [Solirubrobacteraceae bacterium]|nr:cyanophycin synthetase [Solirubrobacteraceae bacterium]
FGMRFGLDRMRRMMTALGSPQQRYDAIHVLGTNGKTSTARMTAAILQRHGLATGAYLSPHLIAYCERVRIGERDLSADELAAALARAARAEERVNRTLAEGDRVTQFELLTAAAFSEMAAREIDVAVVEAGLGGRYDATSVIDAPVTVLTSVGLEHTRWLGPTLSDIAEEKLAVVRPGGTLVLGSWLTGEALAVAERVAGEREAQIVLADVPSVLVDGEIERGGGGELEGDGDSEGRCRARGSMRMHIVGAGHWTDDLGGAASGSNAIALRARGAFQRRNFALATAAAEAHLRGVGIELDERAVRAAAAATEVAGRLQVVDEHPLTVLDGAHNPDAVAALVQALPEVLGGRAVGLVMGVLEDKDAASMLAALTQPSGCSARVCERAWFTAPPSPRALSPAVLQSLARQLGFDAVACEPQPRRALEQARRWAGEGEDGDRNGRAVLVTGSVYLIGDLLRQPQDASATLLSRQAAPQG